MTNFKDLNLNENILKALENKGYEVPTPIQAQAIPHLLKEKDLLGIAQTGTGKTAAFSLPILNNLAKNPTKVAKNQVRALILTPTRELASQIADNVNLYGKGLGLSHAVIFGGVNINAQIKAMEKGQDIVIATPGRLLDLIGRNCVDLNKIEVFVLDEADRMLDMGFIIDVKRIISHLPKQRQTLFFSATMPPSISTLADRILTDPVKVQITPQATTVEKIDQKVNFVDRACKPGLLKHILEQDDAKSVLVFSKTKHGADRIFKFLTNNDVKTAAIHGDKTQSQREKALQDLRDGNVQVLIATDIAARGIDISGISHVINYDIPQDPENYVHRIGRTARAGREGVAISFCDFSEKHLLHMIEGTIKYKIPVDESHPFHGVKNALAPKEFGGGRLLSRNTSKNKASQAPQKESGPQSRRSPSRKISSGNQVSSKQDSGTKRRTSSPKRSSRDQKSSYFSENRRRKDDYDDGRRKKRPSSKKSAAKKEVSGLKKLIFAFGGKNKKILEEESTSDNKKRNPNRSRPAKSRARHSKSDSRSSKSYSNPKKRKSSEGADKRGRKKSHSKSGPRNSSSSSNKKKPSLFSALKNKFISKKRPKK